MPVIGSSRRAGRITRLWGQPDYRNLAIPLLLVAAVARGDRRNARKRLGALGAFQRLAADLEPLFPDLQPDVVAMLRHVEKPRCRP